MSKNKILLPLVVIAASTFILFAVSGIASANSCIDCHKTISPFVQEEQQFNQIRMQHIARNISCSLECHEDRVRQLARAPYQQWADSLHALKGITCEKCHGGDPNQPTMEKAHSGIKKITDPQSPVYYTNVPKTCGECHAGELKEFENSKHYKRLESLKLAPSCSTCHSPHSFRVINSEEFRNFCGQCHSIYKKVAPYEIPVEAEYLLGKVDKLKFNIDAAQKDIFWAKKQGNDVAEASLDLQKSIDILNKLPPMWHAFNLTNFENEVVTANMQLEKTRSEIRVDKPTATPIKNTPSTATTPGFTLIIAGISLFVAGYLMRAARKK